MQVLVTGGAGFIGSHIATELVSRGYRVRVLDNLATGRPVNLEHLQGRIELMHGSVTDPATAAAAVAGCDTVFHQAAIPSVARSVADPVASNEANVTGTIVMLTAAKEASVRRFVYASSSSAYGDNPELPKHEEMTPLPRSPYAVAKLAGEQYCRVFGRLFPLETVALRYFNVFGPRQDPNSRYAAVVPAFILAMLQGRTLRLEGDGTQSRDFTFVDNVVQANLLAMEAPGVSGEMFNVACGQRYDLNCLIAEIAEIVGVTPQVERVAARPGDVPHSLADVSKAGRLLGYKPVVDFREGLRRTAAWLRDSSQSAAGAAAR